MCWFRITQRITTTEEDEDIKTIRLIMKDGKIYKNTLPLTSVDSTGGKLSQQETSV
ncbi:MAG: hypothetical protein QNJ68_21090 [Microcoleaceae cyanobacterium MO_207.B10]|nr:hypothetical protein [Microcoleaceae cyanobacterium MO_207.B10]